MTDRRRIVFLNRCYWPDVEATGQLLQQLCERLSPDWDVTVVAGQPNRNPSGAEYVRRGQQVHQGVTIERLPHTTFNKRSKAGRLTNLLSFTRQVHAWGKRQRQRHLPPPDVIVAQTDPFFLPLVASKIARRWGAKFVFYAQDIYPDIAVALGAVREGMISAQLRRSLLGAYRQADRVVVLDEDMRQRLIAWGLDARQMTIIPNWIDTTAVYPIKSNNAFRRVHGIDDRFIVMHSGNMGMSQQLETLIDATCDPQWPDQAIVALVGDGAQRESLQRYAERNQAHHVRFFDYQPRHELAQSLSAADLHVVSMDPAIQGCLAPSKLYGILASGTPVTVIAPAEFALAQTVVQHQVGRVVQPRCPSELAQWVRWCIDHPQEIESMQHNARRLAETSFDVTICCQKFAQMLSELK